jgi:hypothetical protein
MNAVILTRDEGEQLTSFEGKHVVRLDSANDLGTYREWLVGVNHTQYCIIDDEDTWTLLVQGEDQSWRDAEDDVETFLTTHTLILAA